jgi:hypothetical protein
LTLNSCLRWWLSLLLSLHVAATATPLSGLFVVTPSWVSKLCCWDHLGSWCVSLAAISGLHGCLCICYCTSCRCCCCTDCISLTNHGCSTIAAVFMCRSNWMLVIRRSSCTCFICRFR